MAIYRTGTASMSETGVITGTGTSWQDALSLIRVGSTIIFNTSPMRFATISAIVSATEMRAVDTDGVAVPDGEYQILLSDSLTVDGLAQDIAEALRYWQSQISEIDTQFDSVNDQITGINTTLATKVAKSQNLSDLADKSVAWTNLLSARTATTARSDLGLGGAALLNVGTAAGTVAAGDDSRITGAMPKSGGAFTGAVSGTSITLSSGITAAAALQVQSGSNYGTYSNGSIELSAATPFIDFHYANNTADYSLRMICTAENAIEISGGSGNASLRVNGGIRAGGSSYAGGINIYQGNGDSAALWGINATSGALNFVRGSSASAVIDCGGGRLNNSIGVQCRNGTAGSTSVNGYNFYWNTSSQLECWVDSSQIGAVTMTAISDKMLKTEPVYKDDSEISSALDEVINWKVATFRYKARGIIPESEDKLGFIANDLAKVSPETVSGSGLADDYDIEANPNSLTDAYSLDQVALIAKLTMAVQALEKRVAELESK